MRPIAVDAVAGARTARTPAASGTPAFRRSFVTLALLAVLGLAACPRGGSAPTARPATVEVGRPGVTLRGVAGDGAAIYVALAAERGSVVEARRDGRTVWTAPLRGGAGPLARTARHVVAAIAGEGSVEGIAVRGEPALVVVGLDPASGQRAFARALESSEWVVATSLAAIGDEVLVGGSFTGSLRAGERVVSSGGRSDGFVARLGADGSVRWLVRAGGPQADAVQGVAATPDGSRIAVAGTFGPNADFQGELLTSVDEKTPYADGFVAELEPAGRVKWTATFGSKLDDSVAGVAFDGSGRIALAANAREVTRIGAHELVAAGAADGFVAYWTPAGTFAASVLIGGNDFDGLRGVASVDGRIVVGGFFSGTLPLGATTLTAGGGDDAFLVALDGDKLARTWAVSGDGREEIVALAAVPGGFVAGVAYTARASVDGAALPAPRDPLSGAAVVVRALP